MVLISAKSQFGAADYFGSVEDRDYNSIEMQRLEAKRAAEAESAWGRFLAFLGFDAPEEEPSRGVVVNRGNATRSCSGLARECR
ncbi:hypothetical protein PGB28_07095 [Primorskyibacter aestuariivivens]|uniref:hypothetical protein n=1 Tax=Primorskyibacter aestuariivivens TaxID=1888912 RepID=UPI002301B1D5|nr:hypothetical protein [Primorskyibacter aestuariivivens]MDA7428219.1 hypothetical protein [Primorskyibacter aestuariivivens]